MRPIPPGIVQHFMVNRIIKSLFGDKSQRTYKKLKPKIDEINRQYEAMESLSDDAIRAKTVEFRERLEKGETLDDLLPEAFAAVKQACKRLRGSAWEAGGSEIVWDMVPFDVQLAGAINLHMGNIAEMATGEGKTLVACMPLYLNALPGRGAHLVTVNDYLARRDAEWMGKVYEFLGLTVGTILTDMRPEERRESYNCDITYGTNNEFGFDYLRDNMALRPEHLVQRDHYYAIVDEVDSVLIDEARTPLIISGSVNRSIEEFAQLKPSVQELVKKQGSLINEVISEAEKLLEEAGDDAGKPGSPKYDAGIRLLMARKGFPKHKRLTKIMNDASNQRLVDRVERDYMRDKRIPELEEHLFFAVDEKGHGIDLTDKGREALSPQDPDLFLVPDIVEAVAEIESRSELPAEEKEKLKELAMAENQRKTETIHCLSQLLRGYTLYEKDVDYVVQEDKVIIVDEFTGRLMHGRRWSDGLHQAVEAKEGAHVKQETQTLATITLQNYFRMYDKLAGMTGTADTEAQEFSHTYQMGVAVIPTNRPIHRRDDDDLIYRSQREKFNAVTERVAEIHASGMPILIGTTTVDVSEKLSRMLRRMKISHNVLNAKQHEHEAQIVREAGKLGAVTIATNMAGRGTDIKLSEGVIRCKSPGFGGKRCEICPFEEGKACEVDPDLAPCGLQIVGTERHESRRIDNQLRGRAGRQGDPGYSQFYVSLEDELMRLFASDRMAALMSKGFEEGEAMQHGIATRALSSAQKKIEDINFERRKRTLDYDNVMNKQRAAIYDFRREVLQAQGTLEDTVLNISGNAIADAWEEYRQTEDGEESGDVEGFFDWLRRSVPMIDLEGLESGGAQGFDPDWLVSIEERIKAAYGKKNEIFGDEVLGALSRWVLLSVIDSHWRDHLLAVDVMREGIHLRSYAQLDPLTEYRKEASLMFEDMMFHIHRVAFEHVFRATIAQQAPRQQTRDVSFQKAEAAAAPSTGETTSSAGDGESAESTAPPKPETYRRTQAKVGRNDPCPCGSGKKFKKCHGAPGRAPAGAGDLR
jgi:preprotein translocase subunit SecA